MSRHEYPSLRQGLIGAWCPSLGASGLSLIDRSGFGNHAALVSMSGQDNWRASQGSMALNLDGVDDFVSATPAGNQPVRSMSIWFRPTSVVNASASSGALFQCRSGANFAWYIALGAATGLVGNEYITVVDTTGGSAYRACVTDGGSLAENTWHHLAVVESGTSHTIFVNGASRTLTISSTSPGTPTFNALRIGCVDGDGGGPRAFFSGQIDDARVYNRILTPGEILLLASRRGIGLQPLPDRAAGMPRKLFVNVGGTWRDGDAYVNDGGTWKLGTPFVNAGGTWK